RDVDHGEERVRGRLDPHDLRVVVPGGREDVEVDVVDGRPGDPRGLEHPRQQAVRPPVGVSRDDHVVARLQHGAEDGVLGGHATRERDAVRRAVEPGDAGLQGRTRRVGAAGVLVPAVAPPRVLHERRRQGDRRDDRARRGVGLLPRVHGPRLERVAIARGRVVASLSPKSPGPATPKRPAAHPGDLDARNESTSDRVSTPTGWPPSSTRTDGARSSWATSAETGSPMPTIGIAGLMISFSGRSSTDASPKARSMRSSSLTTPLTSFAANGCSVVTLTTSCEIPSSRIMPMAWRAGWSGVIRTSSGTRRSLAPRTSPAHGPSP